MKRKERSSSSSNYERKTKKTKKISDLQEVQEMSKLDFTSAETLFSTLISPTTPENFFSEYWEKKPLLIQREDTSFYGPLFNKSDLEAIMKREELEFVNDVNVCCYEDGDKLYMNGDIGSRAKWPRVAKDVKERNATVQFHQPQRFKDILWKLNAHLESIFGCLVGANVYITPQDSQGLAPHHDDVEIFILQLEGKKQWKLYKPPLELPQDYSPDLEQESIGEPTHEFELQPGDMVYFPRGTVHQAVTPKGESHSTHITLSTYQQHTWGGMLSSVVSDALDKAMESDVEFRRGLPINCYSYMGLGMRNDDRIKTRQEDFQNQIKHLLTQLANHIDAHTTVDKAAADFMANRLPPIEQKEEAMKDEKGDGEKPPTEDSEIKFRYPEHVRISVGNSLEISGNFAISDSESEDEGSDEEDNNDDDESEDEDMDKKSSKSKDKNVKKKKQDKTKKKKSEESEESDEEQDESSDEKIVSKKRKKEKGKKAEGKRKAKKKGSLDDNDDEDDEKKKSKKSKGGKKEQTKKGKNKKGKHSESEEDKDDDDDEDDDDESFELGDEDTDESEDDEDLDEEGEGPWVFVHHSLNNDQSLHMMGPQQPSVLKFSLTFKDALFQLYKERHDFIAAKSLSLESEDTLYLLTSLWSEGLIDIKQ